uniref:Uncharacterized protein n=1 Tax=Opuntia streptacantha TaxID=393608 RepID=A0A7C9AYX3_OPUST
MKNSSVGNCGPMYDVLIPKLCRSGDFEKGKELWDEAKEMGISLRCSTDVLDPTITEVFQPKRKDKVLEPADQTKPGTQTLKSKLPGLRNPQKRRSKRKQKGRSKKKAAST